VNNREAARTIFGIAGLLEAQDANPYRIRAYRRAALSLMRLPIDANSCVDADGDLALPWLGSRLRRKLGELVTRGRMQFHDELLDQFPPGVRALMTVPGVGPKTAEMLTRELKIRSARGLAKAAADGRLRQLRGIGPMRERQLASAAKQLLLPKSSRSSAAIGATKVVA
jgi:DNA polymerase (family X)